MSENPAPNARESFQEAIDQWRAAWQGLEDNPLYNYVRLGQLRREMRVPRIRRLIGYLSIVLGSLGLTAALFYGLQLNTVGNLKEWLLGGFLIGSSLSYLIYFAVGIGDAVRDGLSVLSIPGRRAVALQLDDMLSITALTSHDVVLAATAGMFRSLWPRVLAGALLVVSDVCIIQWLGVSDLDGLGAALMLAPVTVGCFMLTGCLAAIICALGLIAAGRSLSVERLQSIAGIFLLLGNLSWLPMSFGLMSENWTNTGDPLLEFQMSILGLLSVCLVYYGALYLAQVRSWARVIFACLGPAVLPLFLAICFTFLGAMALSLETSGYSMVGSEIWGDVFGGIFYGHLRGWGAFALINPMAIPHQWCWGVYGTNSMGAENMWAHLPATVALQVLLIMLISQFALRAVSLRRHNG